MSLRFVFLSALVAGCTAGAAACFDDSVPSSFHSPPAEAGSDGAGQPGDAATAGDSPNLVGDAGPGSFYCGQTVCYAGYYCVRVLSDAGVEESAACYPLLQCSDCPCVTNVVATTYCAGDSLGCAGQAPNPLYVTCRP